MVSIPLKLFNTDRMSAGKRSGQTRNCHRAEVGASATPLWGRNLGSERCCWSTRFCLDLSACNSDSDGPWYWIPPRKTFLQTDPTAERWRKQHLVMDHTQRPDRYMKRGRHFSRQHSSSFNFNKNASISVSEMWIMLSALFIKECSKPASSQTHSYATLMYSK